MNRVLIVLYSGGIALHTCMWLHRYIDASGPGVN